MEEGTSPCKKIVTQSLSHLLEFPGQFSADCCFGFIKSGFHLSYIECSSWLAAGLEGCSEAVVGERKKSQPWHSLVWQSEAFVFLEAGLAHLGHVCPVRHERAHPTPASDNVQLKPWASETKQVHDVILSKHRQKRSSVQPTPVPTNHPLTQWPLLPYQFTALSLV